MRDFEHNGHRYTVVPVEGNSEEWIIIKDDRNTRRVSKAIADKAMEYVDKLFK